MAKRLFDLAFAISALTVLSPLLAVALAAVWLQDRHSPVYSARRVARDNGDFTMYKIRSMRIDADKSGVNSTGEGDARVTRVGRLVRRTKFDEFLQCVNIVKGEMSVVGPRPNTRAWGVDLYTPEEMRLLSVRPGITDLASIVFSDEAAILKDADHPDLAYNQLIRPWKSRLGLFYIDHMSLGMDLRICMLTLAALTDKRRALDGVVALLERHGADPDLIAVCRREGALVPSVPPGAAEIPSLAYEAAT